MDFLNLWFTGFLHPSRAMAELRARPAPFWGLAAVLVFMLPVFGVFTWLLMSAFAQLVLRLSSHDTSFDQIANFAR